MYDEEMKRTHAYIHMSSDVTCDSDETRCKCTEQLSCRITYMNNEGKGMVKSLHKTR
jgi:hypothetical protein